MLLGRRFFLIFHFAAAQQNGDGTVQQETGEQSLKHIAIEVADQISSNGCAQSRCQFERHAEANIGGVALKMHGRTCRRGGNHGHKAGANSLPDRDSKMQREDGSQQNAPADAG